jgi:hypothetical protein
MITARDNNSTYLGDGLYVKFDDFGQVVLYTHDGISQMNAVYLEPNVLDHFLKWVEAKKKPE